MWTHRFEHQTSLSPSRIWPVIADIARWPEADHNIEKIEVDGPVAPGTRFRLKPKGGPTLKFEVGSFDAPTRYSDICTMPLARMETIHSLLPAGAQGTLMRVDIEIKGPLAWLWGPMIGRKHAAGLPAQTERILARADQLVAGSAKE